MAEQWRLIITDSENLDGVAPVCPQQSDYTKHSTGEGYMQEPADENGVYDCCPWPQMEAGNEREARRICDLLNGGAAAESRSRRAGQQWAIDALRDGAAKPGTTESWINILENAANYLDGLISGESAILAHSLDVEQTGDSK